MKSYLSLIPISAKVRKRQNRMTILCVVISVLLVTMIFSAADMMIRTESEGLKDRHGNWHIQIDHISKDTAKKIAQRPDVTAAGWLEAFNTDADQPYYAGEKKATLYGADSVYLAQLSNALEEGEIPQNDNEIMLSSNAKLALHVHSGDSVTIQTPKETVQFMVSGFGSDDKEYYRGQTYLVGVYMTQEAFVSLMEKNGIPSSPSCYVQFQNASKASDAKADLEKQYGLPEGSVSENTAVMGMAGKSSSKSVQNMYGIAAILFVLVLLAGVLMISGSMNSNVAQRTKFFGMMRCIGASRRQIIRYVRMEALNWCRTAVPAGLVLGVALSWGVCGLLHYGIGGEFAAMPVFALSPAGLFCGAAVGIMTVLLAAGAPAKRAAKVSPMAAIVSGSPDTAPCAQRRIKAGFCRIERTLGVQHAMASKKNWFLMTASFSLSIILFLCFSVGLDFAGALMPALRSWQPDLILNGYANETVLRQDQMDAVRSIPGVAHVFGCAYMGDVPAASSRQGIDHVNLTSYTDYLLESAEESLVQGDLSEIYGDSGKAATVLNRDNPLRVGDIVQIAGQAVEIVCVVSDGVFESDYSVICSPETFARLTGKENYSMIGVQLGKDATEETVEEISSLAESDVIFSDDRERNQEDTNTYRAITFVVYSFLAVIAMITLFYMINSISMSVTARMKQYGAMRAVGMDSRQLTRMIAVEAFTYAVSGLIAGCGAGIVLSRLLHTMLLTRYFGILWHLPAVLLVIIILFDFVSVIIAVRAPSKRIRSMAVTETINEL